LPVCVADIWRAFADFFSIKDALLLPVAAELKEAV